METARRWKHTLTEFNLFPTHTHSDNDPHQKKIQLFSTRLLIFLLVISLTILIVYNAQLEYSQRVTVQNPAVSTYLSLEKTYGDGVVCPCTNIAIERSEFVALSPTFHQVCSSDFISDQWLNYLRTVADLYVSAYFQYTGSALFTILASFCRLANQTINDALPIFYSTRYISSKVIDPVAFVEEMEEVIDFHISTISKTYAESFELIRDMNYIDALLSGLPINFVLSDIVYSSSLSAYLFFPNYVNYGECYCELTPTCILPAKISNEFTITGLYTGCSLSEALRRSNLVCLYNQTCLDALIAHLNSSSKFNVTALIQSNSSRFIPTANISDVLDVLMVDAWIKTTSHRSYYQQCRPQYCAYTIRRRHDAVYIITTSLGLFGGIYKALFIIIPLLCRFILDYRRKRQIHVTTDLAVILTAQISRKDQLLQFIRSFNLFPSYPPSIDPFRLKSERLMTIVYLILLTISILVLLSYNANQTIVETTIVPTPSLDDYLLLYARHSSNDLSCPCSTITSEYGKFLTLTPTYHQLCTSAFLQGSWMTYRNLNKNLFLAYDFRVNAALFMHALAIYCSLSKLTVSSNLEVFLSNSIINAELLTESLFHDRTNQLVQQFTKSLGEDFIQQLDFLRINSYANQIISGKRTNFYIFLQRSTSGIQYTAGVRSFTYHTDCFCNRSPACSVNMGLYDYNETGFILRFSIPGLRIGCYMNEALRQSTLECFYNQTCVNILKEYLTLDNASATALDSSQSSRYHPTTVFAELIESLLIEQWIWNDSYSTYYRLCQPISCSYQIKTKPSFLIVVTTLLGLIGGLIKVLQMVVPIIVQLIRRVPTPNERVRLSLNQYKDKLLQHLRMFNLFRTKTPLDDGPDEILIQIVSTRLFVVLLVVAFIILLSYNSQVEVARTTTLNSPSFSSYLSFYTEHGNQAICPCTTMVIAEEQFVSITPDFHQICSSDFIDPSWSQTIYQSLIASTTGIYHRDFRFRSFYYFQSLQSICEMATRRISTALKSFYSNTLVSIDLLSEPMFLLQVDATIDLFITSTANTFSRSFRILKDANFNDQVFVATLSSFYLSLTSGGIVQPNDPNTWRISTRYVTYNDSQCSCQNTPTCVEPAYIYSVLINFTPIFPVPGMLIGCYIFEALLQSNLIYFYNQINVDSLCRAMNVSAWCNSHAMDPSKSGGFILDESIERILERVMINRWIRNISYENYFHQCQPIQCRYTYMQKFDLLYIIISILGLIGGLTTVLQLFVRRFVPLTRLYKCFPWNTIRIR